MNEEALPERSITQLWQQKIDEVLSNPRLSRANKVLAYKTFLRPLLIHEWFEGAENVFIKRLEVQALQKIFGTLETTKLYKLFSDSDVTTHTKVLEIRWQRATGSSVPNLKQLLQTTVKTDGNVMVYYGRAMDRSVNRNNITIEDPVLLGDNSSLNMSTPQLRRSSRLSNKK